jgi:hypothetical protein
MSQPARVRSPALAGDTPLERQGVTAGHLVAGYRVVLFARPGVRNDLTAPRTMP